MFLQGMSVIAVHCIRMALENMVPNSQIEAKIEAKLIAEVPILLHVRLWAPQVLLFEPVHVPRSEWGTLRHEGSR
jgi:hypothetical protein